MKTIQELNRLSELIGMAIKAYHDAIKENLQELGHAVSVHDENNCEGIPGIILQVEDDGNLYRCIVDQVRLDKVNDTIMVHEREWNFVSCDEWCNISYLGDAADYVLEAIQWLQEEEMKPIEKELLNSIAEKDIFFIHPDGRIENVEWSDDFETFKELPGKFAVRKENT